jgi:predicted transglutaminase-like cysteine proteinase
MRNRQVFIMLSNLVLKRGVLFFNLFAGMTSILCCQCAVGLYAAFLSTSQAETPGLADRTAAQNVALRFPEPSAFRHAPSLPDLSNFHTWSRGVDTSVSQPESTPPSQSESRRFAERSTRHDEPLENPPQAALPPLSEMSTAGSPQLRNLATHAALAPAALPVTLIDFPVAAALPPIGHSRFCLRYPDDCTVHGIDFRRRNIALTPQRWNELNGINREVNRNISPETTPGTGATEKWAISPPTGDCKAYAITKRHALLARGWPSRSLLLSEVVLPSGEHHLVLVVRLKGANLVLDNLSDDMRLLTTSFDYQWVRIQSPQNPRFWMRVRRENPLQSAMLYN